ncbi:MAG: GNAT family N-acetyltransferase [Clostridia bacterium]|nr:GNAT family N-acetyltransferase [Clostridia bacterium]
MQKLYEFGFPTAEHIPSLKKMWIEVFGDDEYSVNSFFEKTQSNENTICAFYNGTPVSALYAVEAEIFFQKKSCSAYYIYGVCTHPDHRGKGLMREIMSSLEVVAKDRGISYLYLVPAEEALFSLYERLGYKTAFSLKEKEFVNFDVGECPKYDLGVNYIDYQNLRKEQCMCPITVLGEHGFECFLPQRPVGDLTVLSIPDEGYAVYEGQKDTIIVHELWGDREKLLRCVFDSSKESSLVLREPARCGGRPFGMLKSLDSSPLFENGFIGIPYGG